MLKARIKNYFFSNFFSLFTAPVRLAQQAYNSYASYSPTLNLLGLNNRNSYENSNTNTNNRVQNQGSSNSNSIYNYFTNAISQLAGVEPTRRPARPAIAPVQYVQVDPNQNQYSRPVEYAPQNNQNSYRPVVQQAPQIIQQSIPVNNYNAQQQAPQNIRVDNFNATPQQTQSGRVTEAKLESDLSNPIKIDIHTPSTVGKCSRDYPTMQWARVVTNLGKSQTLDMRYDHQLQFNCVDCGPTGVKISTFLGNC